MDPGWASTALGRAYTVWGGPRQLQGEPPWLQGKSPWLQGKSPWLQGKKCLLSEIRTSWIIFRTMSHLNTKEEKKLCFEYISIIFYLKENVFRENNLKKKKLLI
jgi:hypothetical protein